MKIHRLTLRNYRGIEEATVEFADTGVTVVEGDNEVGKTSLAEAIELILEFQASSTAQRIRAVQPVGKDVGAEIELDATMGPYRFSYKKRFHRDRLTELVIHEPSPEQLSGGDAHNRIKDKILAETTDKALFQALWMAQGVDLKQATISDQGILGAALDRAAGREVAGEEEHSLYERIWEEYKRYWTPTGQPNSEFQRHKTARDDAHAEADRLRSELEALEGTVESCASLAQRIQGLEPDYEDQRERVRQLKQSQESVDKKEGEVERLRLRAGLATTRAQRAKKDLDEREHLKSEVEQAESGSGNLEKERKKLSARLESAQKEFDDAYGLWQKAKELVDEADRLAKLRLDDYEHFRDLFDLETMKERRNRVREAQAELRNAEAFLEGCEINDEKLNDILQAQTDLFQAQARLEAEGAQVEVRSHAGQRIGFNEDFRELSSGEEVQELVTEPLILSFPDVADITVRPGSGTGASWERVQTARTELNRRLAGVQAATVDEARRLERERAEAEGTRDRANSAIEQDLRDLTVDQLEARVQHLESKTDSYLRERVASEPLPKDLDEADTFRKQATENAADALREASELEDPKASAHQVLTELKQKETELSWQQQSKTDALQDARQALEEARQEVSDDDLQGCSDGAEEEASKADERHRAQKEELDALNPDRIRAEYETAVGVEGRMLEQLGKLREQLRDARAFLRVRGEEGLQSQYDEAKSRLEHLAAFYDGMDARAQAARLLYETMTCHREEARRAYLAPLREKIESLGRIVFDPTFSVELTDDLRIARRTLNGVTLDFEDLSTGTKEQLGVLTRLACASIAAEDGGVPFILDDALGWSDPNRLRRIGAALTTGSRDCQVIAMTCTPGRYQHVDAQKVVRLPARSSSD